jgi:glutamyl-tRNA reductase
MDNKCHIALVGLNHKTAAIGIRECIRFSDTDLVFTLTELINSIAIHELVLLSTCSRVEFIMATENPRQALEHIKKFLYVKKAFNYKEFEDSIYLYTGRDAVRHLYKVASGMDSMLVGDPQVLGQVRAAYNKAADTGTTGLLLNKLFHRSFAVAKRIRNETNIGSHAVSVSYAVVELANRAFKSLNGKKVLLIGSGEMAELAMSHLLRRDIKETFVMSRANADRERLALEYNAKAQPLDELFELLKAVDIVISSTASDEFVITNDIVKSAMRDRSGSPLLLIDMAVPGDVEPVVSPIENVCIYDIEDLKSIVLNNIEARNKAARNGETIIEDAVMLHENWSNGLVAVKTITDLRRKFDRIAAEETEKCKMEIACLDAEGSAAVEKLAGRIVKKILHHPIGYLRNTHHIEKERGSLNSVGSMFRLNE